MPMRVFYYSDAIRQFCKTQTKKNNNLWFLRKVIYFTSPPSCVAISLHCNSEMNTHLLLQFWTWNLRFVYQKKKKKNCIIVSTLSSHCLLLFSIKTNQHYTYMSYSASIIIIDLHSRFCHLYSETSTLHIHITICTQHSELSTQLWLLFRSILGSETSIQRHQHYTCISHHITICTRGYYLYMYVYV